VVDDGPDTVSDVATLCRLSEVDPLGDLDYGIILLAILCEPLNLHNEILGRADDPRLLEAA
jgi:hypothetical protein